MNTREGHPPRCLNLGASRLEELKGTPSEALIDRAWLHLGDPPDFAAFYETGRLSAYLRNVLHRVATLAFGARRKKHIDPSLYEQTTFVAWRYEEGDRLQYNDSSFDYIYTEHFLEHLRFDLAVALLGELYRILSPGGLLRIVVPDADYRQNEPPEPAGYPSRRLKMSHPNKHKVRWNAYMLTTILRQCGFETHAVRYYSDLGELKLARLEEIYNPENILQPQFVLSDVYIRRPASLIVDGLKPS